MKTIWPLLRLFLPILAFSITAQAQTYTARTINFNNHGDFTQQQLEDAAGIHPGTTFKVDDLSAAAQRLVDTGYFDNVAATLDGKITAVTVLFDIKPTPHSAMLHVAFENFVWLTPDEINATIHTKFPLFSGYLSDNSPHQDDLMIALTAALAAKSIHAQVLYQTWEPTLRHPIREIGFRVESPSIRVANIKLAGVTGELAPLVQKSVNATARTAYTEGPSDHTTADRLLAPLLDAGYIQAALSDVALAPAPAPDGSIALTVSASLSPGEIYHVSGITFAGTPVMATDTFNAGAKLHPGDVASRDALLQTLKPLDSAYRRQGYIDVAVLATPALDAASHQVAYTVTVEPGDQYRLKQVIPQNLDPAALVEFNKTFMMKPGDLFNPGYITEFLVKLAARDSPLRGYSGVFRAEGDPGTHTVDLVLSFGRGAR